MLSCIHLLFSYAVHDLHKSLNGGHRRSASKQLMTRVFDAGTFARSVMLLIGLINSKVMLLIGDTKLFLLLLGLAGVLYGVQALWPSADEERWR